MEHAGGGGAEILTQALLFLAATCLVVPALRKARLSAVMGFLLIGVALGPHVLGRLSEIWPWLPAFTLAPEGGATRVLAELGVVFLLFVIGLEVSLERLWALKRYVAGLGVAQVVATTIAIAGVAMAFGNPFPVAAVLGLAFALSSTALVLQFLRERRQIGTPVGRASFSVLLLQDLLVVPILFMVGALSSETSAFGPGQIGAALLTAVGAIAAIVGAGRLLLRPLFRWVASIDSRETFIAAALLAALGTAAAAQFAGLSMALGAFLAGLLLAGTEFRHQIETDLEPFKDLLLGLFFVTVGLQIDLALALREPLMVLIGLVGLFAVKGVILAPLARAFGMSWSRAIEMAFLLGQAGEFAFIVVGAAQRGAVIPEATADYMLLLTALSIFIAPLVATFGARFAQRFAPADGEAPAPDAEGASGHVVIAGYGRVGQTLGDLLAAQEIPYIAVDADPALVASLRKQGRSVYFGDASRRDVLAAVGAENAAAIVVTMDRAEAVEHVVVSAKAAWSATPVFARARDADQARRLREAGADLASPDTIEAALQLGEALLNRMGVPDEAARRIVEERREAELSKAFYGAR